MENRSFLKNFITLGIGMIIYMVIGFIGTPIITRLVDPADYGRMSLLTTYSGIGIMFLGLGLDQTLLRYFYKDQLDYQRKLVHTCTAIPVAAAVFVGVIGIGGYYLGLRWLSLTDILLLEFTLLVQLVNRFAHLLLRLRYHTKLHSAVNIIQKSSYIVFSVIFVLFTQWSHYIALALATIFSTVLSAGTGVLSTLDIWKRPSRGYHFPVKTSELMRYGLPIMLASSINVLFNALDKLFIQHYCGESDVGIYASAMNLMAVFTVIQTSFNTIWMPAAVEHYEKKPAEKGFYQKGNIFISLLMLCFGATVVLFKDLFVLLLGSKYRAASTILPFLMFEPIMYTISESTVTGIVVQKKTGYQVLVATGACLTNFFGNWLLTPLMGPQGAAISTGVSYIVFFGLRTYFSNRVFPIKYGIPRFVVCVAVLFAFAAYASNHSFTLVYIPMYLGVVGMVFLSYRKDLGIIFASVRPLISGFRKKK